MGLKLRREIYTGDKDFGFINLYVVFKATGMVEIA